MTVEGERADFLGDDGYRYIEVDGQLHRADACVWLWMTGQWPNSEVIHINGDRGDNRWANLRLKENS
jgi:hypothetical protein